MTILHYRNFFIPRVI